MIKNFFLFFLIINSVRSEIQPIVSTPLGEIKGHYKVSYKGKKYEAYEGIPFAQPPVGPGRFEVRLSFITTFKICLINTRVFPQKCINVKFFCSI